MISKDLHDWTSACLSSFISSASYISNPSSFWSLKCTLFRASACNVISACNTHIGLHVDYQSVQFTSVTQSCLTLCDPMDCNTPGFPVHHQLLELTQTHVPQVGDAIQPSHPLSSPSPPAFNPSQQQGLFKWVSSSHQVAKVLKFQLQSASVLPMNITNDYQYLILIKVQVYLKDIAGLIPDHYNEGTIKINQVT